MFGVGGGVLVTPLLSLMVDQNTAIGTSLLAFLGPTVVSAGTHWQLGNVVRPLVLPLMIGAGYFIRDFRMLNF